MTKRHSKKVAKKMDPAGRLRKALAKRSKDELIEMLVELATEDSGIYRRLAGQVELDLPAKEIVEATRRAIADATDFDEREMNRNFDYDYEAYEEVKRNLGRLIELGELPEAMKLALELMSQGSAQVEMSDEGLMTSDIEECLAVVVQALKKSDLSADEVVKWCAAMTKSDRIGCIYDRELEDLRKQFETPRRK